MQQYNQAASVVLAQDNTVVDFITEHPEDVAIVTPHITIERDKTLDIRTQLAKLLLGAVSSLASAHSPKSKILAKRGSYVLQAYF